MLRTMTTTTQPPAIPDRHEALQRTAVAVRGVLAIALGVLALNHPGITTLLIVAFAVFVIADGVLRIVFTLRALVRDPAWSLHILEGIVGIVIGIVALRIVHGLVSLTWMIAEWAGIIGILSLAFAALAWRRLHNAWMWALAGIVALAFAGVLIWATFGGLQTTGYALGFFGLVYGLVSLAIAARGHARALPA
jgi:uncharacterized membrane protein HdeD (DUF308 family)